VKPSTTRTTFRISGRTTPRRTSDFFEELGSPGGASKVGRIEADVPPATDLPPQEHDE